MRRRTKTVPPEPICSLTGKVKHLTDWAAEHTLTKLARQGRVTRPLQIYKCWLCDAFHLGGVRQSRGDPA